MGPSDKIASMGLYDSKRVNDILPSISILESERPQMISTTGVYIKYVCLCSDVVRSFSCFSNPWVLMIDAVDLQVNLTEQSIRLSDLFEDSSKFIADMYASNCQRRAVTIKALIPVSSQQEQQEEEESIGDEYIQLLLPPHKHNHLFPLFFSFSFPYVVYIVLFLYESS